ncbi:MAG: family 16 glycoside hydrolase, partial [Eudoraea sp.]
IHNGVLVQDNVEIKGTTPYIGWPKNPSHGKGPLMLQDHGDNSRVSFRNIWLREL